MKFLIFSVFILFCIAGLFIGWFLMIKPHEAIDIQRRFYLKINWKMEPVSMDKEVRNTRLMGLLAIILLAALLIFILINKQIFR